MTIDIAQYARAEAKHTSGITWNLGEYRSYLSPSSLTMLRRCPRQFQERYIFGRKERPAEAPLIGTAVHAALERNFEQKIASHEDLPTHELLDWYSEVGFPSAVVEGEEKAEAETFWATDPERARTRGRVMLGEYHNGVSPRIQPISVEGSFSIDMGAPVPIVGRFDIEEAMRTIDVKTGKKLRRTPKEDWKIQGAVYNVATGKGVEFHSVAASEKSNAVSIATPMESEELYVFLRPHELALIRENVRTIAAEACMYMELLGPDRPWPTYGTISEWACNYCGFRSHCPAWEHER